MSQSISFNLNALVRKNVLNMKPYSSARDEFKGEADVYLDANENPYPSPYHRYPDPLQWKVKEALAPIKGINPERMFLGNGSDEPIDLIIRAFCEPNRDSILITEPTYGMYAVCADVNAVNIQRVLLTEDYDLNLEATLQTINETTKVIFLCSPNNPTANLLNRGKVEAILKSFNGIVVIDEAYIDFSDAPGFISQLDSYPNLIVLQTFSKAWGLAGLRLGMAFASVDIINVLNKIKYPYNVNIKTQELALEAIKNVKQKEAWVRELIEQRNLLAANLKTLTIVQHVYPSEGNFILVKVDDARGTYQYLLDNKIIVRDRSRVALCDNCLRITVGTPGENEKVVKALGNLKFKV